jgi:hypothetical protein
MVEGAARLGLRDHGFGIGLSHSLGQMVANNLFSRLCKVCRSEESAALKWPTTSICLGPTQLAEEATRDEAGRPSLGRHYPRQAGTLNGEQTRQGIFSECRVVARAFLSPEKAYEHVQIVPIEVV